MGESDGCGGVNETGQSGGVRTQVLGIIELGREFGNHLEHSEQVDFGWILEIITPKCFARDFCTF